MSIARITQPSRAKSIYRTVIGQESSLALVSSCQKTPSSNTSHGDHGEAEACPEPPHDDEPPLPTSGAFDTPLYGPFFSAALVQPLHLFCFARTAGPVGLRKRERKRAAAGVALCFPQKVAEGIGHFDSYVNYSLPRYPELAWHYNLEEDKSVVQSKPDFAPL